MPRQGYKTVTIRQESFDKLEKIAEKTFRTLPETIDFLLETCKEA